MIENVPEDVFCSRDHVRGHSSASNVEEEGEEKERIFDRYTGYKKVVALTSQWRLDSDYLFGLDDNVLIMTS